MSVSKMTDISNVSNISNLRLSHQLDVPAKSGSASFAQSLQKEYEKSNVQFSKHAMQRMKTRGVEMTPGLLNSLNQAVDKARTKGSKDVAVISDKSVFIVNVPNNTVITTMNGLEMKENIFTNIDSAVLI